MLHRLVALTKPRRALGAGLALVLSLGSCGGESTTLPPSTPTLPRDGSLAGELDAIRARHGVPALAAFSLHEGRIVEQAAVGLRATDRGEEVTVAGRSWAAGETLQHNGSNGYWWAAVWLAPNRDLGLFAVTNAGGDPAFAATDEAVETLIRRFEAASSDR